MLSTSLEVEGYLASNRKGGAVGVGRLGIGDQTIARASADFAGSGMADLV